LIDENRSNKKKRETNQTLLSNIPIQSLRQNYKPNEIQKQSRNQANRNNINKPMLSPIEKVTEIETFRIKLNEDYTKITSKTYFKQKKAIIIKWKNVMELLQNLNAKLFIVAMKCLVDIYIEFDEFEIGKNFCFYFKFFANYLELPEEVMTAYETLGTIYKFLFQYNKAIKCYKKQIEIAWILNDHVSELRAYDNIGIQYFYLGNREKAKYYHERMIYGRTEAQSSKVREDVCQMYRNKNFYLFNDDKFIRNYRENDELKDKLKESLALFDENKQVDLESVDIFKNQEGMKNSFISEVDMTFPVILEKYLKDEEDLTDISIPAMNKFNHLFQTKKNIILNKKSHKKLFIHNESSKIRENHIVDNLILSHLSTKRKEFNTDRFKKIFERFDKMLEDVKLKCKFTSII
jgi:tetratricopeptide (TPR) repeat protein